jgi:hypothetical protein
MKATFPESFLTLQPLCLPQRAVRLMLLVLLVALPPTLAMSATAERKMDAQTTAFVAGKRALIEKTAKDAGRPVPKLVQDFFAAAAKAEWQSATNAAERALRFGESGDAESDPVLWQDILRVRQPLLEALGVVELYREMNPKFFKFLGQEISQCLPAGSIYFGGSDEGRFLPTLFSESQVDGRPYFTITQNQLADGNYLNHLEAIYGRKIQIASMEDSQRCFQDYLSDAQRRLDHDRTFPDEPRQIRIGEEVRITDNRVQVSGVTAVMAINGLLVKTIFDKNKHHEFYIEESYPIDWMYPHLTPHRFIFKLNREPIPTITPQLLLSNRQLWTQQTDAWLGPWLRTNTPLAEVMDFIERVYERKDLKTFHGDPDFLKDAETQKAFGRMRAAVAGLYAWHAANAKEEALRERMDREAEYAFRQAVAIGPASPDAVARYVRRLANTGKLADARRLANLATAIDPNEEKLTSLLPELNRHPRVKGSNE